MLNNHHFEPDKKPENLPMKREREEREDSDVDFDASRRSTRVQSKSTIRSALFLAKH